MNWWMEAFSGSPFLYYSFKINKSIFKKFIGEGKGEKEKERMPVSTIHSLCVHNSQDWAKTKLGLNPGLLHEWQGPKLLGHYLLPPSVVDPKHWLTCKQTLTRGQHAVWTEFIEGWTRDDMMERVTSDWLSNGNWTGTFLGFRRQSSVLWASKAFWPGVLSHSPLYMTIQSATSLMFYTGSIENSLKTTLLSGIASSGGSYIGHLGLFWVCTQAGEVPSRTACSLWCFGFFRAVWTWGLYSSGSSHRHEWQ